MQNGLLLTLSDVQMLISVCWIFQQAAYHPEVSKDVQMRALRYGNECATGYLGLLEHVLVVRHHTHTPEQKLTNTELSVVYSATYCV